MSKEKEEELNFEDALKQLEETVKKMEQGELSLDENIKCFEKGNKLAAYCEKQLHKAEKKVEVLLGKDQEGNPVFKEFDPEG